MAKFKYYCSTCGRKEEVEGGPDHDTPECEKCEKEMKRDFMGEGPPGIAFKGEGSNTGFHSVDYD